MFFLPFLAIIMRGQRTVREHSKYSLTVLSTVSARACTGVFDIDAMKWTKINFFAKIGFISQCTLCLVRHNKSNDLSTILYLPNDMICQTLQNTLLFPIQLVCSTQNAYHIAISWGLETDNSHWGPGLKNTVDAEAIRNPIHGFLPVRCSMCEIVHCYYVKGFISSSNVAVSSWFC